VERPLDSGFPGCSIGSFRRVPEEEPFTRDVDGDELAPLIRFYLLPVPVVDRTASLGDGSRIEFHHGQT
jgi:hypothetical protein